MTIYRGHTNIWFARIILLLFSAVLQSALLSAASNITMSQPNGGEEICAGKNMLIRWTSNEVSSVRIELSDDGGLSFPYLLIAATDALSGRWLWEIPNSQASGEQYRIRVIDELNYDTGDTSESDFTIHARTGISLQPESYSFCAGGTAIFRVSASGQNLEYQWEKDGNMIPNATLPTLYINNAQKEDEGEYRCFVKGLCDSVFSDAGRLTIKDSPKVTSDPQGDTLCKGDNITLSIKASGVGLNYAWTLNGRHIIGSNSYELRLQNVTKKDSGAYRCIVSGACQPKDTSETAYVLVYDYPHIIKMPNSQTVTEGNKAVFVLEAGGDGLHYQWQKDGKDIEGKTANILTIPSVVMADSGSYVCLIENKCGKMKTKEALLKVVEPDKPVIELTMNSVDFGNVGVGKTKDTLLAHIIHNNSQVPLTINSIKIIGSDAGDFNIFGISFPVSIPAEQYKDINIEFVPASLGVKAATVTFNTNADNIVSISLIGFGIKINNELTVNNWDFGDVLIGSTNQISHNFIKNIGTNTITIQQPKVKSYDSLNFRLLDEEDYPKTINAGDSAESKFMFIPTIAKSYEVQVLVKNSTNNDLWFRLKGKGLLTDVPTRNKNGEINIFPNPAIDYCEFRLGKSDEATIIICDIYGNRIIQLNNINGDYKWNLSGTNNARCSTGVYLIKIITKEKVFMEKLIIL